MPTAPPPPALLRMMTCWPNAADNLGVSKRATMSVIAPGGNGLIIWMVLLGYCALAVADANKHAATVKIRSFELILIMNSLRAQLWLSQDSASSRSLC